ncbi:MAG: GntR family transcriptional regulator, partial [Candidatus Adiutrix sp.]|nr:GntR family transcriptional regulator [Candidatus Adiutrix sp.]
MIESIRKMSAVDEVFQAIYSRILSGEFPEGHHFPSQITMAESFGVSRPTIREAVNRLKQLGLLASKPKVGT